MPSDDGSSLVLGAIFKRDKVEELRLFFFTAPFCQQLPIGVEVQQLFLN